MEWLIMKTRRNTANYLQNGILVFLAILLPTVTWATPSVEWSDSKVLYVVGEGGEINGAISFVANRSLDNVEVVVSRSIASYVSPFASNIGPITKGETYTLDLKVSATVDASIGRYRGRIKLRGENFHSSPLLVTVNVWSGVADPVAGVSLAVPENWFVTEIDPDGISVRNVVQPSEISDESLQSESYFRAHRLRDANPNSLNPVDWIPSYFPAGFPVDPHSVTMTEINGLAAARMETSEIGASVHYYISSGTDIIEVVHGLQSPQFLDIYQTMLQTVGIVN